jgi:anti-sigma regulatory factor (Ser/Thr protein kinase)
MSPRPPAARPVPLAGGPGRAGAMVGRVTVRESVTLAGRAERARAARTFVSEVLGPGHPCGEVAVLLVSEIFANSVRHSGSSAPGETVKVAVIAGDGVVRVEITDRAGPGTPELRPAGRNAEGGRGLQLVAGLAVRWAGGGEAGEWSPGSSCRSADTAPRRCACRAPGVYLAARRAPVSCRCAVGTGTGCRARRTAGRSQVHRRICPVPWSRTATASPYD